MIEVREGLLADYIDGLDSLLQANWDETGFDFAFKLDKEFYKKLETLGVLVVLGAFHNGAVVGYSVASVLPHPYNPDVTCCNSDVLFLLPAYRHTLAGARLIQATEMLAKARGAHRMLWHARGDTRFAETLAAHGYQTADVILMKGL